MVESRLAMVLGSSLLLGGSGDGDATHPPADGEAAHREALRAQLRIHVIERLASSPPTAVPEDEGRRAHDLLMADLLAGSRPAAAVRAALDGGDALQLARLATPRAPQPGTNWGARFASGFVAANQALASHAQALLEAHAPPRQR